MQNVTKGIKISNLRLNRLDSAKSVKGLFMRYHYLKSLARGCRDTFELIDMSTGEVVGACQIGIPATRHIDKNTHKEIRRLVLVPGIPKNTASYFIALCIKYIRKQYPNIQNIIAYSDPTVGHKGTVYLASNFKFVGKTRQSNSIKVNGVTVHPRTYFNRPISGLSNSKGNQLRNNKEYKWKKLKPKLKFQYYMNRNVL